MWDAVGDKAGSVVKISTPGTTWSARLTWEASRKVDDCFGGDRAGKVGVGEGNGSWVMRRVYPLLDGGLLTKNSHARAAVRKRRGERADAGEELNRGGVIALKAPG